MDINPQSLDKESPNLCGIVMPIAAMGDYSESHWLDVQNVIKEAVTVAGYEARLVSESADATVIIKSIVQNIYNDDIVVCDVSGMNPNVMFELGMRLAFDKPVVIIKDDVTRFSFDISTIEHLVYPKSLRYQAIQQFKVKLAEKIKATLFASNNEGYSSFLSNFGSFTIANLRETTLNAPEALEKILTKLDRFDGRLLNLENVRLPDSDYLNHLNTRSDKLYRSILSIGVGPEFTKQQFEGVSSALNNVYGDDIHTTLSIDENDNVRTLGVNGRFPPTGNHKDKIRKIIMDAVNNRD